MGLERPGTRAEQIAGQLFALGRVQSAAEIVAQLDAIDAGAVKTLSPAQVMQGRPSHHCGGRAGRQAGIHAPPSPRRFGGTAPIPDAAE